MSAYRIAAKREEEMKTMSIHDYFLDKCCDVFKTLESKNVVQRLVIWHTSRFLFTLPHASSQHFYAWTYFNPHNSHPLGLIVEIWNNGWVRYCDFDCQLSDLKQDCAPEIDLFVKKIQDELFPHLASL